MTCASGAFAWPTVVNRFFGGSPLAVLVQLILLSILIGVVLSALGLDPLEHRRRASSG